MGGNVFPDITRRYNAEEYIKIAIELIKKLSKINNVSCCEIVKSYKFKETFGDIDIVYTTHNNMGLDKNTFIDIFDTKYVSINDDVVSIAYGDIQVDFIHSKKEYYDYHKSYTAFNDLGNLVGKLAKRFGLSHGHKGLYLPLRDGTNMFDSILITHDHSATLKFVGLNPDTFASGFDTLDDIFNYVATSPQYNPEIYALENISSIGRIRDKKRDTYIKFLEFCANWAGRVIPYEKGADKSIFLERIFAAFPDALPRFKEAVDRLTIARAVKAKFNGTMVVEMTKLAGPNLGHFMRLLKEDFNFTPAVLLYLSPEQIETKVLAKYYDVFK